MTDRLAKARTYASLSQQELADALGISERTVKRYEAGYPYRHGARGSSHAASTATTQPDPADSGGTTVPPEFRR